MAPLINMFFNVFPEPFIVIPRPIGAIPKPISAITKPIFAIPKNFHVLVIGKVPYSNRLKILVFVITGDNCNKQKNKGYWKSSFSNY